MVDFVNDNFYLKYLLSNEIFTHSLIAQISIH